MVQYHRTKLSEGEISFVLKNLKEHKKIDSIWEIKSFAEPLKKIVCALTDCSLESLENENFKNKSVPEYLKLKAVSYTPNFRDLNLKTLTYRELLQILGTNLSSSYYLKDIWIEKLFFSLTKDSKWLITDCRFIKEAKAIKENGGKLIKIEKIPKKEIQIDTHISEQELETIHYNYLIRAKENDLVDLIEQVKSIMILENIIPIDTEDLELKRIISILPKILKFVNVVYEMGYTLGGSESEESRELFNLYKKAELILKRINNNENKV